MIKTLRVTPLPAKIHIDQTANSVRAEMNMLFTPASARAARHRAEKEGAAHEPQRPTNASTSSGRASTLRITRAPTEG
jgi:hypothetical protein